MNRLPPALVEALVERLPNPTPEHRLLGRAWNELLRDRMVYRRPMSPEETPLQHWLAPTNGGQRAVVVWVSFPTFTGFPQPTPTLRMLVCPRTQITDDQLNRLTTLERLVIDQCPNVTRVDGLTRLVTLRAVGTPLDWRVALPSSLRCLDGSFLVRQGVALDTWLRGSGVRELTLTGSLDHYSSIVDLTTHPLTTLELVVTGSFNVVWVRLPESLERLTIDWPRSLHLQVGGVLLRLRELTLRQCQLREAPVDWRGLRCFRLERVNLFGYPHEHLAYQQAQVYSNTGANDSEAISGRHLPRVVSLTLRDVAWPHLVNALPTMPNLRALTLVEPTLIRFTPGLRLRLESLTVIDPYHRAVGGVVAAVEAVRSLTLVNAVLDLRAVNLASTETLRLSQCTLTDSAVVLPPSLQHLSLERVQGSGVMVVPTRLTSLAIHDCDRCSVDLDPLTELAELSLVGERLRAAPWLTGLRALTLLQHPRTITIDWRVFTRLTHLRVDERVNLDLTNNPLPRTVTELVVEHRLGPVPDLPTLLSQLPRLERYNDWRAATVERA